MKKFLLALIICSAGALTYADVDLREKNFSQPAKGSSEVITVGWLDHKLKITATAEADAEVIYNKAFNFIPGMFYKVSGDVSGRGEIIAKLYFFNQDGTAYKVAEKSAVVRQKLDEFEARFDLREFTPVNAPYQFKVVIGVKKAGSVVVDDLELEVDDD